MNTHSASATEKEIPMPCLEADFVVVYDFSRSRSRKGDDESGIMDS